MFKRCKVVLLPIEEVPTYSNKVSKIRLDNEGKLSFEPYIQGLYYSGLTHVYQHLYILSDDEIKNGDIGICNTHVHPSVGVYHNLEFDMLDNQIVPIKPTKVIATTDPSLTFTIKNVGIREQDSMTISLPSPSQSFITKFVEEYNKSNKIEEVMVEYTDYTQCTGNMKWYTDAQRQDDNGIDSYYKCDICGDIRKNVVGNMKGVRTCGKHTEGNLKVAKDNTITIRKIKDSWNREEVIAFAYWLRTTDYNVEGNSPEDCFDEYLKNN